MTELNAKAKEFYPEWAKKEEDLFDELEKRFVERNAWLFESHEYESESRFNEMIRKKEDIQSGTKSKPTYAEVIKSD